MLLIDIDKAVYRKHLNIVIVSFIVGFAILSLLFGALLIEVFADTVLNVTGSLPQHPNNFRYNLLGVVLALLACAASLHQLRKQAFFKEIYYVWQLKQLHNRIYRRLTKIKKLAEQLDINALIILNYYYVSLKQIYLLDDNTLTLSTIEQDQRNLTAILINNKITISTEQFDQEMLAL